jgi:hypothetical protein
MPRHLEQVKFSADALDTFAVPEKIYGEGKAAFYRCTVPGCVTSPTSNLPGLRWSNRLRHRESHLATASDAPVTPYVHGYVRFNVPYKAADCSRSDNASEDNTDDQWDTPISRTSTPIPRPGMPVFRPVTPISIADTQQPERLVQGSSTESTSSESHTRRSELTPPYDPAFIAQLRDEYVRQLAQAHKKSIHQMKALAERLTTEGMGRLGYLSVTRDLNKMIQMFEGANVTGPRTLQEHQVGLDSGTMTDNDETFLFLSADQATELLRNGRPRVSIIIPRVLDPRAARLLDVNQYLKKLAELHTLDVHDIDERIARSEAEPHLHPFTRSARSVVHDFLTGGKLLNCLDLSDTTSGTVPTPILHADGWDLLGHSNPIGKNSKKSNAIRTGDLYASSKFQLLACKDVFSMPHIDRAGVVTTVQVHHGDKLWMSWASRSNEDLKRFGVNEVPVGKGFQVLLREGDTLIQPAGTPHAPYTGPNSSMAFLTGCMFTPSQNLDRQMQCIEAESWTNSSITNEDFAEDLPDILARWKAMMERDSPAWPWPDKTAQAAFLSAYRVCSSCTTLEIQDQN